jgi:hypothetical protein
MNRCMKAFRWALLLTLPLFQYGLAQDYHFHQLDDEWGVVSMEAEHYSEMVIQSDSYFEPVLEPEFFSGEGGLIALPTGAVYATGADAITGSAMLNYLVDFVKADSVYIWMRGAHEGGGDDSFHAGIDGEVLTSTERIGYHGEPYNVWDWLGTNMDNVKPAFYIDTPGTHVFSIFIREGGLRFDKIVLCSNPDYDPLILVGEYGPDETVGAVSVENHVPLAFQLRPNFPNPFNPCTTLSYVIGQPGLVNLTVYDIQGHQVASLVDEFQSPGAYTVAWNAFGETGTMPSGVYMAKLESGSQSQMIRMLLLK